MQPTFALAAPAALMLQRWTQGSAVFDAQGFALYLLTLPGGCARVEARQRARRLLCEVLGDMLRQPADRVVLLEGPRGPRPADGAGGIHVSLSYAGEHVLIGLGREFVVGVDLVRVDDFVELPALARQYLDRESGRQVMAAPQAARAVNFAQAWAEMEARSKCLGLPLAEMSPQRALALQPCGLRPCAAIEGYRAALAFRMPAADEKNRADAGPVRRGG